MEKMARVLFRERVSSSQGGDELGARLQDFRRVFGVFEGCVAIFEALSGIEILSHVLFHRPVHV
jgi:hypothetical protein